MFSIEKNIKLEDSCVKDTAKSFPIILLNFNIYLLYIAMREEIHYQNAL